MHVPSRISGSRFITVTTTLVIIISTFCNSSYAKDDKKSKEKLYVSNEILVRFFPETSEDEKEAVRKSIGAIKAKSIKSISVEYWKLPKDISTEEALEHLKEVPIIQKVEPNHLSKPM